MGVDNNRSDFQNFKVRQMLQIVAWKVACSNIVNVGKFLGSPVIKDP